MQECIHVKRVGAHANEGQQLERLRRRYLAGGPVTLADAFAAAGLTPCERHVLRERLPRPDGTLRSHAQIAADRVMRNPDGSPCSRQWVEQVEAEGLRKLGLGRSIAAAVHGAERAGRALNLIAGGRAVNPGELYGRAPVRVRLRRRKTRWEVEHEAAVRALLRSRA
jgi:hypothetical protein